MVNHKGIIRVEIIIIIIMVIILGIALHPITLIP